MCLEFSRREKAFLSSVEIVSMTSFCCCCLITSQDKMNLPLRLQPSKDLG